MAKSITALCPPSADQRLSAARDSAIHTACLELQQIADALQEHIEKHEEGGSIVELSRGMLIRVSTLADAICMTQDASTGGNDAGGLFDAAHKLIYGAGYTSEVAHA